jgi:hypothetical protein
MYLRVRQPMGDFLFDYWGHTDAGKLTLGSGLFVGPNGVACDHHFNPRLNVEHFLFAAGSYRIEVFATIVGQIRPIKLSEIRFDVGGDDAPELLQVLNRELFLYWNPEERKYEAQVERPPMRPAER